MCSVSGWDILRVRDPHVTSSGRAARMIDHFESARSACPRQIGSMSPRVADAQPSSAADGHSMVSDLM